jgi:prepilin peptidase CpaA
MQRTMTSPALPSAAAKAFAAARARPIGAACAACAAGLGLLLAGQGMPPFLRAGTAAFLSLVVFEDVRRMRIPNRLTFPALLLALVAAAAGGGVAGLGGALLGAGLALVLGLGPYALGWLGAGDVKALAALGALFGARALPPLFLCTLLAGGALALAHLSLRGGLFDLLSRWWLSACTSLATRRLHYFAPARGSAAAAGLPFGVAIAFGAIAVSLWGGAR